MHALDMSYTVIIGNIHISDVWNDFPSKSDRKHTFYKIICRSSNKQQCDCKNREGNFKRHIATANQSKISNQKLSSLWQNEDEGYDYTAH